MARDRRPSRTPPAAPRRSPRRPRTLAGKLPTAAQAASRGQALARSLPALPSRLGLTRRALVVISVVLLLGLSYANSLRIYVGQQQALADAQVQIQEHSARIQVLQEELDRWNDPAYVKSQARERLGWVVPGEKGYRVLGADGRPIGGQVTIDSAQAQPPGERGEMWFDRLWGSVQAADSATRIGG